MPIPSPFSPWHSDAVRILVRIRFGVPLPALQLLAAPLGTSDWPSSGSSASRAREKYALAREFQRACSRTAAPCADSERRVECDPRAPFPWQDRPRRQDRTASGERPAGAESSRAPLLPQADEIRYA